MVQYIFLIPLSMFSLITPGVYNFITLKRTTTNFGAGPMFVFIIIVCYKSVITEHSLNSNVRNLPKK